jgi:hypothetical protein
MEEVNLRCVVSTYVNITCMLKKSSFNLRSRDGSYKPSFSGGRDQEDHSSKTAPANSSTDPITKLSNTRKGWWSGSSHKVPA